MEANATKLNPQLAALYCRVSSERQEKEGTIQSQLAELEAIAKVNADVVVERYLDDGYSGELLERPALDKLRNDASKHLFSNPSGAFRIIHPRILCELKLLAPRQGEESRQ